MKLTTAEKLYLADYLITNNLVDPDPILSELRRSVHIRPHMLRIFVKVLRYYGLSYEEFISNCREPRYVRPRHAFAYIANKLGHDKKSIANWTMRGRVMTNHVNRKFEVVLNSPADLWYDHDLANEIAEITNLIILK